MLCKGLSRALVVAGIVAVALGSGTPAFSKYAENEEVTAEGQEAPQVAMNEEMMAKWQEYSTPNENHQILGQLVGTWDCTVKWWMSPDAPADISNGTAMSGWIMDGRFIEQTFEGVSMGQPFSGKGITGFDNAGKEYISNWYDSMGTGMMVAKGNYDPATKTLTETGDFMCPFKGQMSFRWVTKIIDENNYTFETYMPDESGKEFKSMEIIYKKKS